MANANTVKRVNYYDHQFLRAPDFVDEQTYHLNSRRLHNSTLHTWGVVQGLAVTVASGGTGTAVTVSAGVAIDSAGREIVLPADSNLELGGEASGTTLILTIAYAEVQSDPTTDAGGPGNTRVSEIPNLSFTQVVPADKSITLILARIPRTATGLGALDTSDRKQAGVVLGSDLTVNSVTLKKDGIAQANWPALSCSGANQAALANAGLTVSGSVGIGPSAPDRALSVNGTTAAGIYANVKNASHEILLGVDTAAVLSAMTASDLQIRTNNVTRMTIAKGDGNTQIQSTLIVGPVPLPTAVGRITATGPSAELGFAKRSLTTWSATPAAGDRYVWYNPDGNARLFTEANGDLLTVTAGGDLSTRGDLLAGGNLLAGGSDVYFTKTNHAHVGFGNTLGYAAIENDGSSYNALMIIGRTTTTTPLMRVIKMWDHLEMNGDALKPGGGAWGTLSDETLKTNVNPMTGVLKKLLGLRGVTFDWKDPEKFATLTGTQVGFIAQQVEEVFPEWVGRDSDGLKTVSVRGFEALAVEAFRELRDEIQAIKAAVSDLQAKLDERG